MKIKIGILLFLLVLLNQPGSGQGNKPVSRGNDSLPVLRNDLAFNVIPTFQFLSGAYTGGQIRRFSLIYRHLTTHNFYLRYGIVID
ncbi:MAG TPA: hypothetical protein VNZ86_06170, partial [Bacteroidia bacterium]|nr:hypothetical protein [Bacteroidia bacterium]